MRLPTLALIVLSVLVVSQVGRGAPGVVTAAGGSTLNRPEDPVVVTGADVSSLIGAAPGTVVAFRYDGGWVQIPVQVDERDVKTFATVYNGQGGITGPETQLFYTDANMWTGPDSDPNVDGNDEIAFMSADAGGQAPSFSQPAHTQSSSGVEIQVTDPLASGQEGWVYLFRSDGTLDPSAGQSYVSYNFSLNSGNYKATYKLGPNMYPTGNPENSTITTPNYSYHFGDRWQEDGMQISAGGATNVDILDRHKALFAPGSCGRSEDTFDGYVMTSPIEGAFVANKSGPVRAIRSYVGANSGPLTAREHIFYAQRQEVRTDLRVHPIPSIMDFMDYSSAASGMTYYNDLNTGGVTIDGVPDSPAAGPIVWQMVTGAQGTVFMSGAASTNIPGFAYTSYYLDKSAPPPLTGSELQCTGDASAYGSSGTNINSIPGGLPCTDPRGGSNCPYFLHFASTVYYEAPGATVAQAQSLNTRANNPLTFSAQPFVMPGLDSDADGCPDDRELGADWHTGGQRDPNFVWDFFDVPVPPLLPSDMSGIRNKAVSIADVIAILSYIGTTAANPSQANANGAMYGSDLNANGAPDGQEYDRAAGGVSGQPWRSGAPSGAVTIADALVDLNQVGTNCN